MLELYILILFLGVLAVLFIYCIGIISLMKALKKNVTRTEKVIGVIYACAAFWFFIGTFSHGNEYYTAVDPVEFECYTPISSSGLLSFIFYQVLFNIALAAIWSRGAKLPPLTNVLYLCSILVGIAVNATALYHVSSHDRSSLHQIDNDGTLFFIAAPAMSVLLGIFMLYKSIRDRRIAGQDLIYKNPILNRLNQFVIAKGMPLMVLLFLLPVLFLCTLILLLFGQEPDGIVRAFTDTTLWRLSQQMHPPILQHEGHYLCTVAAKGNPGLVRPLAIGQRGGKPIIVNRQLQIANAFEEMIRVRYPRMHRKIRKFYDNYGYNLSLKINTSAASNAIYLLMKPLEWVFLVALYSACEKPEKLIARQYLNAKNI